MRDGISTLYVRADKDRAIRVEDDALATTLFTDHDDTWFAFYSDSQSVLKMDRRMPQLAPDDAFTGLTAPVQLFANENDVLFPAGPLIERARQVFPNLVEADVLRGYKHVPPFAAGATDAVLDRIRTFLLDAGSAAPSHG